MKKLAVILLLSFFSIASLEAQVSRLTDVKGKVTDETGEPLIGVTVYVKGTSHGTMTDLDGNYTIRNVSNEVTLLFSCLGYESVEVKVKSINIDVVMREEASRLDEVVVTGYQEKEIRKMTGSVAVVSSRELKDAPLAGADKLLQGKLAGVNVQAVSGRPGESAKIRIRGTSSITGNSDPLWVVDGVPLQKDIPSQGSTYVRSGDFSRIFANGIGGINPKDIASISVLKDASAAAIYGSQAAGGVIVITTRRGEKGRLRVDYSGTVSLQTRPQRSANLMNSAEKIAWEDELYNEFTMDPEGSHNRIGIVGMVRSGYRGEGVDFAGWDKERQNAYLEGLAANTTDWFESLFRTTVSNSHYLSLSGGSDKSTYFISGGYSKNNGMVVKTDYDSYTASAKISCTPISKISFGLNSDFSYQKANAPSYNVDMFRYAYFANPYERVYNEDGSYAADNTYFALAKMNGSYSSLPPNGFNIFREIYETYSVSTSAATNLTANLSWNIVPGLTFSGLASFNYNSDWNDNMNSADTYAAWQDRPFEGDSTLSKRIYGSLTQTSTYNTNYLLRGHFSYSHTFAAIHHLNLLGGAEIRSSYAKSLFSKRYGYDEVSGNFATPSYPESTRLDYDRMVSYANIIDGLSGQSINENRFASFYGAADYILNNKYVFNASARTDGSNNFGSDEQFNATWSAGFSWNMDEENWLKDNRVISSMTLRTATGFTGGVNKNVYPVLVMNYDSSFRTTDEGYYRMGHIYNAPNPHLSWEKTWDMKAALNMGFLKDRIRTDLEVYRRKGFDLVTSVAVPTSTGFSTQSYNTSEQLNQGVELSLYAIPIRTEDFTWSINVNAAYNQNILTKYDSPTGSVYGDYYIGYPLGKIFTGKTTGINPQTGIYNYLLRDDAVIGSKEDLRKTANYLFYIGTSNAPVTGGVNMNFTYRNLTLSLGGNFSLGGIIIDNISCPISYSTISGTGDHEPVPSQKNDLYVNHLNVTKDSPHRWTESNPVTDGNPRIIDYYGRRLYLDRDVPTGSTITNATLLQSISYFKVGSATLIYQLRDKWAKAVKMSSLSVSATANNLFVITNYDGIDPETPGAVYPQCRSFSLGISCGF